MAYRAEIQIGVKGAKSLSDLTDQINLLGERVDLIQDNFRPFIQTVKNFQDNLSRATKTLKNVRLGTDDERVAIEQYVQALGEANAVRARQNSLIDQQIAKQTAANRVVREASTGFSAARYGPQVPAGTGRQGDPEFVSSPVEQRIQRLLQAQAEELQLKEALRKLDEQAIKDQNTKLDLQAELVTVLNKTRDAARFRAAQPAQQLALPAFRERGLQLLDDSVKANESQLRIEQALNGERARGVRFLQKQAEEERRQLELGIAGVSRTNLLPANAQRQEQALAAAAAKQTERLAIEQRIQTTAASTVTQYNLKLGLLQQMAAIGRRIQQSTEQELINQRRITRQVKVRRGRERQRRSREALGSGIIGGAFPLLFGQGAGASFGGAAGGFAGGLLGGQFGFGLSLVGTQIGASFDQLTESATNLGKALNPLTADVDKIIEATGAANTKFSELIKNLQELGKEEDALRLATQKLTILVGQDGVQALKDYGNDTAELGREFEKAMALMAAGIAKVVNQVGLLTFITNQIEEANLLSQTSQSTDPEQQARIRELQSLQGVGTKGTGNITEINERRRKLTAEIKEEQRKINAEKERELTLDAQAVLQAEKLKQLKENESSLEIQSAEILKLRKAALAAEGDERLKLTAAADEAIAKAAFQAEKQELINKAIAGEISFRAVALALQTKQVDLAETLAKIEESLNKKSGKGVGTTSSGPDGEKIIKTLVRQTALQKELNTLAKETPEDKIGEIKLSQDRQLLQLQNSRLSTLDRIAEITDADLRAVAKRLELELTAAKEAAIRLDTDQKITEEKDRQKDAIEKNLRNIQNEIDLSKARLNGTEDEVRLEQQLQAIGENAGITDAKALEDLKTRLELLQQQLASEKAIQEVRNIQKRTETAGAGLRAGFIGQAGQAFEQQLQQGSTAERATEIALLTQEMELAELQAQSLQNAVLGIGDAFATAMTTGVAGLIDGTKNAEEVFSDFLKGVGNALLQSAQQMIATYIAIGIARAFAGLGGGGSGGGSFSSPSSFDATSQFTQAPIPFKANGGPVQGGQPYMVGERGPELFVPSSNGGVMRNEDMRQLMGRSPVGNGPAMNFTFETTNIGGQEFVSREQLEAAMATTRRQAASDGAKRGMNMTLDRMQNSPRTRARVGIS